MDLNGNNSIDYGIAFLFETNTKRPALGYYYRRKKVKGKHDKPYGKKSRIKRKVL